MNDIDFYSLAAQINKLIRSYQLPKDTAGHLQHHQYVKSYDDVLENAGITKQQFVAEVNRRSKERKKISG